MSQNSLDGIILQVNISNGGIPKRPVEGSVWVHKRGLDGDACRNLKVHGGPLQAVLLISVEQLEQVRSDGFEVSPGALGENLTVQNMDFGALEPGLRFRAGDALLQLTKLRKPCRTLDPFGPGIQKALIGRGGHYASVIEPGYVRAGDSIRQEL